MSTLNETAPSLTYLSRIALKLHLKLRLGCHKTAKNPLTRRNSVYDGLVKQRETNVTRCHVRDIAHSFNHFYGLMLRVLRVEARGKKYV